MPVGVANRPKCCANGWHQICNESAACYFQSKNNAVIQQLNDLAVQHIGILLHFFVPLRSQFLIINHSLLIDLNAH